MNNEEVLDMCRKLGSRYNKHQDYEDIVSEGVVSCLNMVAKGIKDPNKLYYSARSAMYHYVNVGLSKLSYSKGMSGRKAATNDNETLEYVTSTDTDIIAEDLYGSYELKNCVEKLKKHLTPREWRIFMILYNNNNNIVETANVLNVSKQRVDQIRNEIRYKIVTICELDY